MSHSNTQRMLGYWQARRGHRLAPLRASIDPADFADTMTQAFVLGRAGTGAYPLRLAGALLDDLHRGPLLGADFIALWTGPDRPRVQAAVEAGLSRAEPVILHGQGRTLEGGQARLELLLCPLMDSRGRVDRMLGLYQPLSPLFRLQDKAIERLYLLEAMFASGEAVTSPLRIAAIHGRRIA
jgi:hypothetical protein